MLEAEAKPPPGDRRAPRLVLGAALALAFLSGVAALAHQLLWTRRLVDVLGASSGTFSKAIGAFFLGLALGSWLASRGPAGRANFWGRVAGAELAVAALALPMLFSAFFANWIYGQAALGGWMKFLLPVALITPPAIAMGLVVPWMVRALASSPAFASQHAVWLYAANTCGGVAGTLLVVLEGLPRFGLAGASSAAIGLNVMIGAGVWLLARGPGAVPLPADISAGGGWLTLQEKVLAFASGFLVLALEVVLQHQFTQVTINSLFSSAVVLVLVLAALAAAALLVPPLVRWAGNGRRALGWALAAAALLCAAQPFFLIGLRGGVNILPYELTPLPYAWEVIKLGLLAVCPMLVAAGLIFPLLLRNAVKIDARRAGLLFAWNGVGGWLGAEIGQVVIAPLFGLWTSVTLIAALYALLYFAASRTEGGSQGGGGGWVPVPIPILLLAIIGVCAWLARGLPQAAVAPAERLAAIAVGKEGVVAVLESGPGDWRMLFNNSYTLGGSKAQFNQERQALLPLLLHGNARSVATLGVATGSTAAGAALSAEVERVDAIELSELVLRYAETYFAPYNREVFHDPRVRFIHEDARWIMARDAGAHDVIIGDLFLPWRTGEGRMFTVEHFQNVRRALKPGGLFCQWLPMFQLTRPQFEAIVRTFRLVFPDAYLVRGDFYTDLPILGLVGGQSLDRCDWRRVAAACATLREQSPATDPLVRHAEGIAMMVLGPVPEPPPGPLNTLANGWLEWDAGRAILGMRTPWFIGVPLAEYVRGVQRAGQLMLPEELREAQESGQFFLTLDLAAKLNLPALPGLKGQMFDRLPASLRHDSGADWRQWPMRIKPEPLAPMTDGDPPDDL